MPRCGACCTGSRGATCYVWTRPKGCRGKAIAISRSRLETPTVGCSALLPLTISFAQEQLLTMGATVAGAVIACYQVGYGIAAFGTGPLVDAGVSLRALFGLAAIAAVIMGGLSFILGRKSLPSAVAPAPTS